MAEKDLPKPTTEILPNRVSRAQAMREGRGLPGNSPTLDNPNYMPVGRNINGVHTITYAVDAPASEKYLAHGAKIIGPVSDEEDLNEIQRVIGQYKRNSGAKYIKLSGNDAAKADLIIFSNNDMDGIMGYATPVGTQRFIVIKKGHFRNCFVHEFGHAHGLSHSGDYEELQKGIGTKDGKTGYSLKYNKDGGVMSYLYGLISNANEWLGPYDLDQLHQYYGKPKDTSPDYLVRPDNTASTLYSEIPITLDYRDKSAEKNDPLIRRIRLPEVKRADGEPVNGIRFLNNHRLAFDTDIQNVFAAGSQENMNIRGNELPNLLVGGDGENTLINKGNGDTLIGNQNKNRDTFIVTAGSHNTSLHNFDASLDRIFLPENTGRITLRSIDSGHAKWTEAKLYDAEKKLIASFNVLNASPEGIQQGFGKNFQDKAIIESPDIAPPTFARAQQTSATIHKESIERTKTDILTLPVMAMASASSLQDSIKESPALATASAGQYKPAKTPDIAETNITMSITEPTAQTQSAVLHNQKSLLAESIVDKVKDFQLSDIKITVDVPNQYTPAVRPPKNSIQPVNVPVIKQHNRSHAPTPDIALITDGITHPVPTKQLQQRVTPEQQTVSTSAPVDRTTHLSDYDVIQIDIMPDQIAKSEKPSLSLAPVANRRAPAPALAIDNEVITQNILSGKTSIQRAASPVSTSSYNEINRATNPTTANPNITPASIAATPTLPSGEPVKASSQGKSLPAPPFPLPVTDIKITSDKDIKADPLPIAGITGGIFGFIALALIASPLAAIIGGILIGMTTHTLTQPATPKTSDIALQPTTSPATDTPSHNTAISSLGVEKNPQFQVADVDKKSGNARPNIANAAPQQEQGNAK